MFSLEVVGFWKSPFLEGIECCLIFKKGPRIDSGNYTSISLITIMPELPGAVIFRKLHNMCEKQTREE